MQQYLRSVFSLLLLLLVQGAVAQQNFSIGKAPAWVEAVTFNATALPANEDAATGSYLLLVDKQSHAAEQAQYRQFAVKILNEKGLQEEADISIDYDPSYQQLVFHSIEVHRNGNTINKLVATDFQIIQREADAAQKLYDGRLTAIIHLKDVRVGDVLTYSYTIVGRNPVYQGRFFDEVYWQYGVPVAKLTYRLLLPQGRRLTIKETGAAPKATVTQLAGQQEYRWQQEGLEAIAYESQIPYWYNPAPFTQMSEFTDWGQVVALFIEDYQAAREISDTQWQALSEELFTTADTEAEKITRLLHFVQNDIRYLGLEHGISAYKPHAPVQVLQQKYGDCKDKALLLCALLYKLGIEASPALVNTYQKGFVADQLPTPGAFNHCIVRMSYQDSVYWFDATINSQGGTFKTVSLPNYGKALVMKRGEKDLTPVANYGLDLRDIRAYYVINKGNADSELTIMSRYTGFEGEAQRSYFRNNSLRDVEENYLNYYAGLYPGISLKESLKVHDRTTAFETEEHYTIKDLWSASTEFAGNSVASFYPLYLNDMLAVPEKKLRKMPFALNYPLQVEEEIILEMPEQWGVTEDRQEISNEFFTFTYQVSYQHPVIRLSYTYELHQDHVPADKVAAYIAAIDKVKDLLGYEIHYSDTAQLGQQLSYPLLALALLMTGLFIAAAVVVYKKYDPAPRYEISSYDSIGGWLFLPLVGLFTAPISILFQTISWDYFNAVSLHQMFDRASPFFNPLHGTVLVVELLVNLALAVLAVCLLLLMIKRRSSFPTLMIGYLAAKFVFMLLELLVLEGADLVDDSLLGDLYKQLAQSLIVCLIWIPYFLMSERVKETFTLRRSEQYVMPVEEAEQHQEPVN